MNFMWKIETRRMVCPLRMRSVDVYRSCSRKKKRFSPPVTIVRRTLACHSDKSELHAKDRNTSNAVPSSDEQCLCPLVGFSTKKERIYSPVCISGPCGWF